MRKALITGFAVLALLALPNPGWWNPKAVASQVGPDAVQPLGLRIPAARIDARVEPGNIVNGVPQPPSGPWSITWYNEIGALGQPGNVVLTGYADYPLVGPAVFSGLGALQAGDAIEVAGGNGDSFAYRVAQVAEYPADQVPVRAIFGRGTEERLILLTVLRPLASSGAGILVLTATRGGAPAPTDDPPPLADLPPPEECRTVPRNLPDLKTIAGHDAPATPPTAAEGKPADEETERAVTTVIRERIACVNAGDYGRLAALFSDEFLSAAFDDTPPAFEDVVAFSRRQPAPLPPATRRGLPTIEDVRVVPDGRVAATVRPATADPREARRGPVQMTFVLVSQSWLIDAEVALPSA